MKKTVMPKQAAPVDSLSPATAGAAGAEKGVVPNLRGGVGGNGGYRGWAFSTPFAGDDAE
jgi:hypothetical protein